MPRSISHRARWDAPAATVHDVLVDADYLRARLKELGGNDPALLEHDVDDSGARLRLRHAIPVEFLPSVIQRFTGGDLVLDRIETWAPSADGGYEGTVEVTVRGLPGSLTGTQQLRDAGDGASESHVEATASVPVPLVSGRIEGIVADQVSALLESEDDFTRRWL